MRADICSERPAGTRWCRLHTWSADRELDSLGLTGWTLPSAEIWVGGTDGGGGINPTAVVEVGNGPGSEGGGLPTQFGTILSRTIDERVAVRGGAAAGLLWSAPVWNGDEVPVRESVMELRLENGFGECSLLAGLLGSTGFGLAAGALALLPHLRWGGGGDGGTAAFSHLAQGLGGRRVCLTGCSDGGQSLAA